MKLAIMAIVGLLIGLAGGTGGMMYRNKRAATALAAEQEKAAKEGAKATPGTKGSEADSTAAAEGESAAAAAVKPDGEAAAAHAPVPVVAAAALAPPHEKAAEHATPAPEGAADAKESHAPAEPDAAKVGETSATKPAAGRIAEVRPAAAKGAAASGAAEKIAAFKQLARIFGNMKPADAVKVLAFMTDDEVEGVVRQFAPRQAAELLSAFPKERAAVLSRRLLVPRAS